MDIGIKLEIENEPLSTPRPITLQDLQPLGLPSSPGSKNEETGDVDKKPDLSKLGTGHNTVQEEDERRMRPSYGFEGGPALPPKWTYPTTMTVSKISPSA